MSFLKKLFGTPENLSPEEEAQAAARRNFETLRDDGVRAMQMGEVPFALKCFEEALNITPGDRRTQAFKAEAHLRMGQYAEALPLLKALAVAAAIEFGRRKNCHNTARIINPRDVVPFVRSYSMYQKEYFLTVTLNGGHEVIQIRVASVGTVSKAIVHPREIFSEAIKENAAAIIVCHNHPSGNCTPSDEDIKTTSVLMEAADILGIALLDHVIFDKTSYFSFVENGLLFNQ